LLLDDQDWDGICGKDLLILPCNLLKQLLHSYSVGQGLIHKFSRHNFVSHRYHTDINHRRQIACSMQHAYKSPQEIRSCQLLHLLQTNRGRDPRKAHQSSYFLSDPRVIARHIQTRNGPLQRLLATFPIVAAGNGVHSVFCIALVFLFHGLGEFTLALALGAVLAE